MNRRRVLVLAAGTAALTAGCLSDTESPSETTQQSSESRTEPPHQTTDPEIQTIAGNPPDAAVDCSDDTVEPVFVAGSETLPERVAGIELTASTEAVTLGDDIGFSLRNVDDQTHLLGTPYKYEIHRRENDEWIPVYYTDHFEWIDEGIEVAPDDGFDWAFTVAREGLQRENHQNSAYYVCSPIESGTYRFVYWGIVEADGGAEALAATFAVEDS
jgi:hypothetical protein